LSSSIWAWAWKGHPISEETDHTLVFSNPILGPIKTFSSFGGVFHPSYKIASLEYFPAALPERPAIFSKP
jgi:hypothetical protein